MYVGECVCGAVVPFSEAMERDGYSFGGCYVTQCFECGQTVGMYPRKATKKELERFAERSDEIGQQARRELAGG